MCCSAMIPSDIREQQKPVCLSERFEHMAVLIDATANDIADCDRYSETRPYQLGPSL